MRLVALRSPKRRASARLCQRPCHSKPARSGPQQEQLPQARWGATSHPRQRESTIPHLNGLNHYDGAELILPEEQGIGFTHRMHGELAGPTSSDTWLQHRLGNLASLSRADRASAYDYADEFTWPAEEEPLVEDPCQINGHRADTIGSRQFPFLRKLQQSANPILSSQQHSPIEPELSTLSRRQEVMEKGTLDQAVQDYAAIRETLFSAGKAANLPAVQKIVFAWYEPLITAIQALQEQLRTNKCKGLGKSVGSFGPPLLLLPADKLAVLTLHETLNSIIQEGNIGVPTTRLLLSLGDLVRLEIAFLKLKERFGKKVISGLKEQGVLTFRRVNQKAKEALEDGVWRPDLKVGTAALLMCQLMKVARITPAMEALIEPVTEEQPVAVVEMGAMLECLSPEQRSEAAAEAGLGQEGLKIGETSVMASSPSHDTSRPAFKVSLQRLYKYPMKRRGMVFMDSGLFERLITTEEAQLRRYAEPRYKPMLVRPRDWINHNEGGYLLLKSSVIRGEHSRDLVSRLRRRKPVQVYEALNYLGQMPWRVNEPVLDIIQMAWQRGLMIGDLPSQQQVVVEPLDPSEGLNELQSKKELERRGRRVKKRNMELYSLQCDTNIKLDIAQELRKDQFYFPFNLDFRGRAYPVPPNLNHLGSDLCRGILTYAERRPLGQRGLYWLEIHLANLCGKDKLSFEERSQWAQSQMEEIYDSARHPLEGRGWWKTAEEPWQALAACFEIVAARESGCPEKYESHLPVHMDGSCNGLQHYAALGRDHAGGQQVNLIRADEPQDVYTGVCDLVVRHVHKEATTPLEDKASEHAKKKQQYAQLVDGLINRKVIKQTVMTSVYGVTYIGARKQIQARLKEKFDTRKAGSLLSKEEEDQVYQVSRYLARITLDKLSELFSSARCVMEWLAQCSSLVASKARAPMTWDTPLGLPVIQPYRRGKGLQVKTLLQTVILADCNERMPVSPARQRSAFPPNFVHSLDSTHMLMTANRLKSISVPFTAVHDSYWSHAANVDIMNHVLRECFVDLYRKPILEDLRDSLVRRFPDLEFPPVPAKGNLRLEDVLQSPYFFD